MKRIERAVGGGMGAWECSLFHPSLCLFANLHVLLNLKRRSLQFDIKMHIIFIYSELMLVTFDATSVNEYLIIITCTPMHTSCTRD